MSADREPTPFNDPASSEEGLPLLLTVPEVASLLRIGRDLAYAMAAQGRIPTIRLGRRVLVPRDRLLRFLQEDMSEELAK